MATWAVVSAEIQRLNRIPGVHARHRTTNSGTQQFQLYVLDTRNASERQAGILPPNRWIPTSTVVSAGIVHT